MKILVTGAAGFVGRALCERLRADGEQVFCTVRVARQAETLPEGVRVLASTAIGPSTDFSGIMDDIDVVVHLAARVHVLRDDAADPLAAFLAENVDATANLARQAARAGVRRFVYLSTVKVHGEGGAASYREEDPPEPADAYGRSKLEAEEKLAAIMSETGLEVVVLRPPLVYGPGVKANFLQLLKLVSCGVPLPLANVRNRRSMIFLGNLVDAIVACARHPRAAGQTFLVSDGEDVSTPELIRRVAAAVDRSPRLLPLEPSIIRFLGKITGRTSMFERLLGSLAVDSEKIRRELGWHPPFTMQDGLTSTANWYMSLDSRKGGWPMKRLFDITVSLLALFAAAVPLLLVALLIKLTSKGSALYWSDRIGRNNELFRMPKFRTMRSGTPAVATHLLKNPDSCLTPIGKFLRKTSIDELPQLFSILKGDMSFVGPRPALFNQDDLKALRTAKGIHRLTPGLTGWAQINGRDDLPVPEKVAFDEFYLENRSFRLDMLILVRTFVKVAIREGVSH